MSGGINRLRVKGGASAKQLYDLQNAYITNAGSIDPREGTIRTATLSSVTAGLMADNGTFNIFSPYSASGLTAPVQNPIMSTITGGDGTWVSGTTYYFVVTAVDALGNQTAVSNETSVKATGTTFTPKISWFAEAGVTAYEVYYGTSAGAENKAVTTTGTSLSPTSTSVFSAATLSTANLTSISVPAGYTLNVLSDPNDPGDGIAKIWFAKPFMGFPYVVAQFDNGDIWHYWLQSDGSWTSSTDYTSASIVTPDIPNGIAYQGVRDFPAQPLWTAETVITSGQYVEPNTPTGFAYQAIAVSPYTSGQNSTLLLHFDGNYADSGPYDYPTNPTGLVEISAGNQKYGTGCLGLLATVTTATPLNFLEVPVSGPLNINATTEDWTIECWAQILSTVSGMTIFSFNNGVYDQTRVDMNAFGSTNFETYWGPTAGRTSSTTFAITTGVWYAVALVRHGTTITLFVNGVAGGIISTTTAFTTFNSTMLYLGADNGTSGGISQGFIDEFRVTAGTALYTTGYTPSGPFPNGVLSSGYPHTGASEPVWPTVAGGIVQEFGDFDVSATDAGTTQGSGANSPYSTASALGSTITDRYGDSATVSNSGIYSTSSTLSTLTLASTKVTTWKAGHYLRARLGGYPRQ